jgi:glycosyltransferase involved in cell wall biosynthesis
MTLQSLSVFFPCYNDAATIGNLVRTAHRVAGEVAGEHEVIVVNDGSRDGSAEVLCALKEEIPSLRVITHADNRGYGGALRSGFEAATKAWVFYTDGDGQYDVGDLRALVAAAAATVDAVNGTQIERHDGWERVAAGRLYNRFVRMLFGIRLSEVDCDFRLIRRAVMDDVRLTRRSGAVCVELVVGLERWGARIVEVPVRHYPRSSGRSQFFRPLRIVHTLLDVVHLRWVLLRKGPPPRRERPR